MTIQINVPTPQTVEPKPKKLIFTYFDEYGEPFDRRQSAFLDMEFSNGKAVEVPEGDADGRIISNPNNRLYILTSDGNSEKRMLPRVFSAGVRFRVIIREE